ERVRAHGARAIALRPEHVAVDGERLLVFEQSSEVDNAFFAFEAIVANERSTGRQRTSLSREAFDVAAEFDLFRQQCGTSRAIFRALVWEVHRVEPGEFGCRFEDRSLSGHCLTPDQGKTRIGHSLPMRVAETVRASAPPRSATRTVQRLERGVGRSALSLRRDEREHRALRIKAIDDPGAAGNLHRPVDDLPDRGLPPLLGRVYRVDGDVIEPMRDRLLVHLLHHAAGLLTLAAEDLVGSPAAPRHGLALGPAEQAGVEGEGFLRIATVQFVPGDMAGLHRVLHRRLTVLALEQ